MEDVRGGREEWMEIRSPRANAARLIGRRDVTSILELITARLPPACRNSRRNDRAARAGAGRGVAEVAGAVAGRGGGGRGRGARRGSRGGSWLVGTKLDFFKRPPPRANAFNSNRARRLYAVAATKAEKRRHLRFNKRRPNKSFL